jgi:hypothetical protein
VRDNVLNILLMCLTTTFLGRSGNHRHNEIYYEGSNNINQPSSTPRSVRTGDSSKWNSVMVAFEAVAVPTIARYELTQV